MDLIVASAAKQLVQTASLLLRSHNNEQRQAWQDYRQRKRVVYCLGNEVVCRSFYRLALGLSKHKCDQISRHVVGDESWMCPNPQVVENVCHYKRGENLYDICVAFWSDYFTHLCPVPRQGLLLFPANMSRKAIYALDFISWLKTVYPLSSSDMLPPEHPPQNVSSSSSSSIKLYPHGPVCRSLLMLRRSLLMLRRSLSLLRHGLSLLRLSVSLLDTKYHFQTSHPWR
jgi:hypothetical protein